MRRAHVNYIQINVKLVTMPIIWCSEIRSYQFIIIGSALRWKLKIADSEDLCVEGLYKWEQEEADSSGNKQ